jgi:hypothetical protein
MRIGIRRRASRLGAFVALSVVAATMVVVAPAHAAITSKTFSGSFQITRDGQTYKVGLFAVRSTDEGFLSIDVRKTRNPDGPEEVTSGASWSRSTDALRAANDLSTGGIRPTDAQMGSRGNIDLTWDPSTTLDKDCTGFDRSRRGKMRGVFRFDTKSALFGVIKTDEVAGRLSATDTTCPEEGGGGGNACPAQRATFDIYTADSLAFFYKNAGAAAAHLALNTFTDLTNGWSLSRSLVGKAPAENLQLNQATTAGSFKSANVPWLDGSTTYTAGAEPSEGSFTECGDGKFSFIRSSYGTYTGGLTANYLVGPDVTYGHDDSGSATRTIVSSPT